MPNFAPALVLRPTPGDMSHSACRGHQIFARNRFFHDGVRLQTGKIVSTISQLRALARLHEDRCKLHEATRETDHTDHLAAHNPQHCRRRSSGDGRRRRSSEQCPKRQVQPESDQPFPPMLPATILLAYDSCSADSEPPARYPVGREDGLSTALRRNESLTHDEGVQTPGRSRRRSSSGTGVAERREGGRDGAAIGEGGRCGVQVRVVEFQPGHNGRSQQEDGGCRGIGQVGGG